jgi:type III secretion system YscI/HrpB-like protein
MSNPLAGAGGGTAKIAMQQLQQMQQMQQPQNTQQMQQQGGAKFQQAMQTQQPQEIQQVQKTEQVQKTKSIREVAGTQPTQKTEQVQKTTETKPSRGAERFLEGLTERKNDVDRLMQQAIKGKSFNNKELIVLQYKVSNFSLEMDLVSKVVEKASGGIKQAMNTQV